MPKFQVESLIHINAVYLVEAETADEAGNLVQAGLRNVETVPAEPLRLPACGTPVAVVADAEAIGVYPEGVSIP